MVRTANQPKCSTKSTAHIFGVPSLHMHIFSSDKELVTLLVHYWTQSLTSWTPVHAAELFPETLAFTTVRVVDWRHHASVYEEYHRTCQCREELDSQEQHVNGSRDFHIKQFRFGPWMYTVASGAVWRFIHGGGKHQSPIDAGYMFPCVFSVVLGPLYFSLLLPPQAPPN